LVLKRVSRACRSASAVAAAFNSPQQPTASLLAATEMLVLGWVSLCENVLERRRVASTRATGKEIHPTRFVSEWWWCTTCLWANVITDLALTLGKRD
jgi:hypothetical protein